MPSNFRFFQGSHGASNTSGSLSALNRLFDKYRGKSVAILGRLKLIKDFSDNPVHEPDTIGVDGSMRYLGDIGVKLDEVVLLAVLTELSAPTMGELTRGGFVEGWKTYQYAILLFSLMKSRHIYSAPKIFTVPIRLQSSRPWWPPSAAP